MGFRQIDPNENLISKEHEILSFWQRNKIFEKLVKKNKNKQKWSFIDGPITANNPMGVHHAWGRTYKDLFQRYKAMQGYEERYQNGFDCQGLWVEVEVEKELGFKSKKDIENYGIQNFVNKCKERVLKYSQIQTEQSIRLGQWMDWQNSYYTMSDENNYAIWHFLKKCQQKKLLYKGHDVVPWCLRCGTAISQHEILTEEYQELTHKSVYLKLPIKNKKNEFLLVWTTTPWTLPANVAVAVNSNFTYLQVEQNGEKYYLGKNLKGFLNGAYRIIKELKGKELVGLKYDGPFANLPAAAGLKHKVIGWKDVAEDEGSGLVHIAPGCGQEDFALIKNEKLAVINPIDDDGNYKKEFGFLAKRKVKEAPEEILADLKKRGLVYKIHYFKHRYPTCWRCKEELIFRLVDEWYIDIEPLRAPMIKIAKEINWLPAFGLARELDWLKNMQDWLISKKRYWGLALPIYECSCGHFEVIGSKEELQQKAVEGWDEFASHSPHRPWVDKVKIKCSKCAKVITRIADVGNPWLDAGIVPFSTLKYFQDKNYWHQWFPAQFICESFPGQFRNWFYSLICMGAVFKNCKPFETVLGYALVRDEKGEEMHKSKGNAIWFDKAVQEMGADVMRWMFVSADPYSNLCFGYKSADEIKRRFMFILKNVYSFFVTYANLDHWQISESKSRNILDRWILAKLNQLIKETTASLDEFQPSLAAKKIESFTVNDLSTWYLRRSRRRRDNDFYATMYQVLKNLLKILAPFVPYLAEQIYQDIKSKEDPQSVHLCDYPRAGKIDQQLLNEMAKVRKLAETAHAQRAAAKIRVRQPLAKAIIKNSMDKELINILQDEINVKAVNIATRQKEEILLDTELTAALKQEGSLREVIRFLQALRKNEGLKAGEKNDLYYWADGDLAKVISQSHEAIEKNTSCHLLKNKNASQKEYLLEDQKIWLSFGK